VSLRALFIAGAALVLCDARAVLAQDILVQPSAQAPPSVAPEPGKFAAPPCDGDVAVLRLTELTPNGTMEGYLKAVAAHLGWFRSHGYANDDMVVAKVMVEDPSTHQLTYSKNRVLAIHMRPPVMGGSTGHDAGWDAFHDLYRKNSNIVESYNICIPRAP
jgi:hypothetical protein